MLGSDSRPAVDIIVSNLSGNVAGRALVFVDLLRDDYRVRLIGPAAGALWIPLLARSDVETVITGDVGWGSIRRTATAIKAEVAIAIKPLVESFGASLTAPKRPRVILDIDDPELALITSNWRALGRTWMRPNGLLSTLAIGSQIFRADALTVSGPVLQARVGGVVIPHSRDDRLFDDPVLRDRLAARLALGVPSRGRIVVYVGTVRSHKGIGQLGRVAARIRPAQLYVVGADDPGQVPSPAIAIRPVSYRTAIQWLAAADVVLVPQQPGRIGDAQVPAKLSDALAVGRAMVVTDLPPIRSVTGDAAAYVPPGDDSALPATVLQLLSDSTRRAALEVAARQRFAETVASSVVRPKLLHLLHQLSDLSDRRSFLARN
jgi:glycosyltransferase involved in cell wall biosynthesis